MFFLSFFFFSWLCGFAGVFLPPHKLGWKCALILKAEAEEHWCVHYTCNGTVYKPKLRFIAAFFFNCKVFVLYFTAAMRKLNMMCWMCRRLMDGTDHVGGTHSAFCVITLTVQLTRYSYNVFFCLLVHTVTNLLYFSVEFDSNTPTAGGVCLKTRGGKSSYATLAMTWIVFVLNKLVIPFLLRSHPEVLYCIVVFPFVYFVWLCLMIPLVICAQRIKTVPFYAVPVTSHGGWEIRRENVLNKFLSKRSSSDFIWRTFPGPLFFLSQ